MFRIAIVGLAGILLAFHPLPSDGQKDVDNHSRLAEFDTPGPAQQQLELETTLIRDAEQNGRASFDIGRMWAKLASDYEDHSEFAKSEDAYNRALRLLQPSAAERADYAIVLENLGSLYDMMGNFVASERCVRRSRELHVKLGDPLSAALSQEHLANVHRAMHKYRESRREALEAYQQIAVLKDVDADNLLSMLLTLSYVICTHGNCGGSLQYAKKAWVAATGAFPPDSTQLGLAHMALGYAEWRAEMTGSPDVEMREGIRILTMRLPTGHPYVLSALEQYRAYLAATHRKPEAEQIAQKKIQLRDERQTVCANCTVSVHVLR